MNPLTGDRATASSTVSSGRSASEMSGIGFACEAAGTSPPAPKITQSMPVSAAETAAGSVASPMRTSAPSSSRACAASGIERVRMRTSVCLAQQLPADVRADESRADDRGLRSAPGRSAHQCGLVTESAEPDVQQALDVVGVAGGVVVARRRAGSRPRRSRRARTRSWSAAAPARRRPHRHRRPRTAGRSRPSLMSSGSPKMAVASTGRPKAIASSTVRGMLSTSEAHTRASAARYQGLESATTGSTRT